MRNGLLHDGVAYWAARTPHKPAVVIDDEPPLSYRELADWSDGIAAHLQEQGARPGDHVVIAASNAIGWAAAAVAILKAGAVVVPFNDRLGSEELGYQAVACAPRIIIADAPRAALLREAGIETPILLLEDFDRWRGGAPAGWFEIRLASQSIALIIFTSGSTARPKGAMLTHCNYLAKFFEVRLLDDRLGSDTRALVPLGLHSSPGCPWGIFFTTTIGGTLYATMKYDAERTLRTLTGECITSFIGTPMIYDQISRLPGFESADFAALHFARIGGASATSATFERWRDKGVLLRHLYGMTEVGGGSMIATEEEAAHRPMACGRGLAFSRFRIVDATGDECPPGVPGEVLLQGPGMMVGYWNDPDATAIALDYGWMYTGDIGVRDEEGYFTFVDRAKEMIKSGGYNVSPAEIEAVLADFAGVVEVAAFAVPDDKFDEVPCVLAYMERAAAPLDLLAYCRQRLAKFKLPKYILVSPDPLPRLANQKFDRRQLKAFYGDPANRPDRLSLS